MVVSAKNDSGSQGEEATLKRWKACKNVDMVLQVYGQLPVHTVNGGMKMGAQEQSTAIHSLALTLSKLLSREEATRLGLLLVQLGTTLDTITALQELDSGVATESLKTQ